LLFLSSKLFILCFFWQKSVSQGERVFGSELYIYTVTNIIVSFRCEVTDQDRTLFLRVTDNVLASPLVELDRGDLLDVSYNVYTIYNVSLFLYDGHIDCLRFDKGAGACKKI
jgi:hypothetical protein